MILIPNLYFVFIETQPGKHGTILKNNVPCDRQSIARLCWHEAKQYLCKPISRKEGPCHGFVITCMVFPTRFSTESYCSRIDTVTCGAGRIE